MINLRKKQRVNQVKGLMESLKDKIRQTIHEALGQCNWGIYSQTKPLEAFPVNGEDTMYKVNQIDNETFIEEVLNRVMDS